MQRKVLQPNDFEDLARVARSLNRFERCWSEIARPFLLGVVAAGLIGFGAYSLADARYRKL